jgi:hypothetical protein
MSKSKEKNTIERYANIYQNTFIVILTAGYSKQSTTGKTPHS